MHVSIVSPHPDDAALSLGALIRQLTRDGHEVRVVNVFSGNPSSTAAASSWDRMSGFRTAGEAAAARRAEDVKGLALLGASGEWLDFEEPSSGAAVVLEDLIANLVAAVAADDVVLLPGWPLLHPDHRLVRQVMLSASIPGEVALYEEAPYAMFPGSHWLRSRAHNMKARSGDPTSWVWYRVHHDAASRASRDEAVEEYRSQLPQMTRHLLPTRVAWFLRRGERVALRQSVDSTQSALRDYLIKG